MPRQTAYRGEFVAPTPRRVSRKLVAFIPAGYGAEGEGGRDLNLSAPAPKLGVTASPRIYLAAAAALAAFSPCLTSSLRF